MECNKCKWNRPGHPRWSGHIKSCIHPNVHTGERGMANIGLKVTDGAVEAGYFDFPFNFDPVWVEDCRGFKPVD